eukprot:TRINITY_DN2499_c0_g3_i1.p1 TRINITY_DN2499_c0_g3~~TRINITY_DN2499_c0_g3_i1.p1  ORF type:complete len:928 (+),score=198.92 TRINITY_DN2499_c0_g3_i1:272-3055(+)
MASDGRRPPLRRQRPGRMQRPVVTRRTSTAAAAVVAVGSSSLVARAAEVGCAWTCPAVDSQRWALVQQLDFARGEIGSVWTALREEVGLMQADATSCQPGWMLARLWALLAENAVRGPDAPRLILLEAMNAQLPTDCASPHALLHGGDAARPWALAVLGSLRRVAEAFASSGSSASSSSGADAAAAAAAAGYDDARILPLRPCKGKLRYHESGFSDIVEASWVEDDAALVALHRPAAYLQLGHGRCGIGMAAAHAVLARSLTQLGTALAEARETFGDARASGTTTDSSAAMRGGSANIALDEWIRAEASQIARLAAAYTREGQLNSWEVAASDWAPLLQLLHGLAEAGVLLAAPNAPRGLQGASPRQSAARVSPWRYSPPLELGAGPGQRPWDDASQCVVLWQKAPALAPAVVAAAALATGSGKIPERHLAALAALGSNDIRSCDLAAVVQQLAVAALRQKDADGVAKAVCQGSLVPVLDLVRNLAAEALLDSRLSFWLVLIFGLLDHLRKEAFGNAACVAALAPRELCAPESMSQAFLRHLRWALASRRLVGPSAAASFLARANSLCSPGLVSAHLALAETLLLASARWEGAASATSEAQPVLAPAEGSDAREVDGASPGDGSAQAGLDADLHAAAEPKASPEAWPAVPVLAVLGNRRGARHRLWGNESFSMLKEDVWFLLEGAWTIAAGERPDVLIAGDWPITTMLLRVFSLVASTVPWRPPPARSRPEPLSMAREDAEAAAPPAGATRLPDDSASGAPAGAPASAAAGPGGVAVAAPAGGPSVGSSARVNATDARAVGVKGTGRGAVDLEVAAAIASAQAAAGAARSDAAEGHHGVMDVVEEILESAGEADLADQLYALASREGGAREGGILRGVEWLYAQHYVAPSKQLRAGKDFSKFLRRLRLLVQSPSDSTSGSTGKEMQA